MADAFDAIGGLFGLLDIAVDLSNARERSAMQKDIADLKAKAAKEPDPVQAELASLRAMNGELRLYVATLLRLLLAKGIMSRDDLATMLENVDGEDGKMDQAHAGKLVP
jgi:hypothetical protein